MTDRSRFDRRDVLQLTGAGLLTFSLAGCTASEAGSGEESVPRGASSDDDADDNGNGNGDSDDADESENGDGEEDVELVDEEPDYDGWFDDVDNYDGTLDFTGEDTVEVVVGAGDDGLLYDPAAIEIDAGTTVVFEWTGNGGDHNVAASDDSFESELVGDEGHTFEHTFDDEGTYTYLCTPHEALGMKGAVNVL
ncbi:halocyanin domain-containing protein [Halorubraceae archaeon YAN]|nr:halocyanin domain-containing protein [Halorubraceae archaeon YAN]